MTINKTIFKTTKKELVLNHLEENGALSRHQADYLYKVGSLTKTISVLRSEGHLINDTWKSDSAGNQYKSYSL